jgi:AcrR family transcriptional regulator
MAIKEMVRSGGRSARIQLAVHDAVKTLEAVHTDRADLTVPQIAAQAGVTPSTIYRRWGDLQGLLADVAAERLRPVGEPDDTGSTRRDIEVYMEQYLEEMSTEVGKALLRDVLTSTADACSALQCWRYTYDQLGKIAARAIERGEKPFDPNEVVDKVVAPVVYHILFGDRAITAADVRKLVAGVASLG